MPNSISTVWASASRTCSTHVLAALHDPAYREANSGALRMEWPRIPLPGWPDGDEDGAADELAASAARGRELAALLDSDTPVPGVTEPLPGAPAGSALRPEIAAAAVPSTTDGGNMTGEDFALTVGWGHFGQGEAVMPGQGRVVERPYTASERAALGRAAPTLGGNASDPNNRGRDGQPANHANHACSHQPDRRGDRQNDGDTRRHHVRHLPERPGLLAKRPSRRLELQARRLPGP